MAAGETLHFRSLCEQAGLAVTHQRQVIYDVLCSIDGHPSPEEVYDRVKQRISSISLATVYKNLHLFIDSGIFAQVSFHHGSMRMETNHSAHHHLLCTRCKTIHDVDPALLGLVDTPRELPGGFRVERLAVDVLGICVECQASMAEPNTFGPAMAEPDGPRPMPTGN